MHPWQVFWYVADKKELEDLAFRYFDPDDIFIKRWWILILD